MERGNDAEAICHFELFLKRAKEAGVLEDYAYDRETSTAKIKPYFSIRPILHVKVKEELDF
jgi:hypothetical protein